MSDAEFPAAILVERWVDSIPDHPARSSVAIPTELPGPNSQKYTAIKWNENNVTVEAATLKRTVLHFIERLSSLNCLWFRVINCITFKMHNFKFKIMYHDV